MGVRMAWTEVVDFKEVLRLYRELQRRIKESTRAGGQRRVGYPGSNSKFPIRVGAEPENSEAWVFCGIGSNERLLTLLGRMPADPNWQLMIDLQINFRPDRFSRDLGGAFLKDEDGNIWVANRGILTRKQRLAASEIDRLLPKNWWVRAKGPRGMERRFLPLARLDSPQLFSELSDKAERLRIKLNEFDVPTEEKKPGKGNAGAGNAGSARRRGGKASNPLDEELAKYRREFDGIWTVPPSKAKLVRRTHGKIVDALKAELATKGNVTVTKAMDLVLTVQSSPEVHHVFEVKTSFGSQAIFTALGQLLFNGAALQRRYRKSKVNRYLVLPGDVKESVRQRFCRELGFEVINFVVGKDGGVKFPSLPPL